MDRPDRDEHGRGVEPPTDTVEAGGDRRKVFPGPPRVDVTDQGTVGNVSIPTEEGVFVRLGYLLFCPQPGDLDGCVRHYLDVLLDPCLPQPAEARPVPDRGVVGQPDRPAHLLRGNGGKVPGDPRSVPAQR
jgi:hypothetical protein